MKKAFQSSILLFTLCLGLTTLGFSSWVFTQDSNINIDGVVDVGDLIERNALTKVSEPETFSIYEGGIKGDGKAINECGVSFHYSINNLFYSDHISEIIYNTSLKIENISTTIEPYFKNMVVNGITYGKASPFPTYVETVSALTYKQNDIVVALDRTHDFTDLVITYNFIDNSFGNFYDILINNIKLTFKIAQAGAR